MEKSLELKIAEIAARENAFDPEAYRFVAEAVTYTGNELRKKERRASLRSEELPERRHLSALELLTGAREFARKQFGAVAGCVLEEWGIVSAADFGRIVYLLIGAEVLAASPQDDPRDFEIDFDFSGPRGAQSIEAPKLPKLDL